MCIYREYIIHSINYNAFINGTRRNGNLAGTTTELVREGNDGKQDGVRMKTNPYRIRSKFTFIKGLRISLTP